MAQQLALKARADDVLRLYTAEPSEASGVDDARAVAQMLEDALRASKLQRCAALLSPIHRVSNCEI